MVIDGLEQELVYYWLHRTRMLRENQPPSYDNADVEHIAHNSNQYHLIDGTLFRWGGNGMMMKCISWEEDIQFFGTFIVAYADRNHHGVLSSAKHSDMDSIGPQLRMAWWRSSPSAETISSFRSKPWSMEILFVLSISLGFSQSGDSTSWSFYPWHWEDSDYYSSLLTRSPSGWRLCQ
jgi:hypothetical protein